MESTWWHLSRLMTKPTKWHMHPAKTQISLGVRPVWSESLLSAWRKLGSLATYWAHSKDSDQTRRMPRLIWVFTGSRCHFVGFVMRRLIFHWSWLFFVNPVDKIYKISQNSVLFFLALRLSPFLFEPPCVKTNKMTMRPVWSDSSLCA